MVDYRAMYAIMFNAATDAANILTTQYKNNTAEQAIAILQNAQLKCEELYIPQSITPLHP